jgi:hypothetical protein
MKILNNLLKRSEGLCSKIKNNRREIYSTKFPKYDYISGNVTNTNTNTNTNTSTNNTNSLKVILNKNTKLSNKNIIFMKKFKNFRNNAIKVDSVIKGEIVIQTFWSDFVHLCILDSELGKNNFGLDPNSGFNSDLDYTNLNDDSYFVFQDPESFIDYKNESEFNKCDIKINENESNIVEIINHDKPIPLPSDNELNLSMISRIPQEFNLDIKTDGNLKIINAGDSKLLADKYIKIEFNLFDNESKEFNIFEGKRLRTENFYLKANNRISVNIKSYLEANIVNFVSLHTSIIRIKKMGIVKEGYFKLNEADFDCRSIYGPKITGNYLEFNINDGNISIGTLQGNVRINVNKNAKINIDNLECQNFELNCNNQQGDSLIEIFINDVGQSCFINSGRNKLVLYINSEKNGSFKIKTNLDIIGKEKNPKESPNDDKLQIINVNASISPNILELSSWDYTRKKIESKIKERGSKPNVPPKDNNSNYTK